MKQKAMNVSIETDFLSRENELADNKKAIKVVHSNVFDVMLRKSRGFVHKLQALQGNEVKIKIVLY